MKNVNSIIALDNNLGIGYEGKLPWPRHKEDMAWFKRSTKNSVIVMGRKTWESLPKKLPGRVSVVLSRNTHIDEADRSYMGNIDIPAVISDIRRVYHEKPIFFIGGAEIYRQALPYCDSLYITHFFKAYKCDTFMKCSDFDRFKILEYLETGKDYKAQIRRVKE